jgi:MFS transporter, ACS family, tartrate transporter
MAAEQSWLSHAGTDLEHDRIANKVLWKIVPFLFACYVVAYIDRANVGIAGLTMTKSIGLSPSQFGFAAGIFFLGYFIAEIPSNLALQRFGARRWIARIMITWGFASAATVFARGPISFSVFRFVLGLAEAGFTPGVFLYFSTWFPARYRGRAVSMFMLGLPVSSILGAPLSSSLLALDGVAGLAGWQWMLLIEAVPAVLLGIACLFVLADGPAKVRWLSQPERTWLAATLESERLSVERLHPSTLRSIFTNWRVLTFAAVNFLSIIGSSGVGLWMPQIMRTFGFSVVQTGFVVAIPYIFGAVAMIYFGRRSDRSANRAIFPEGALFMCSAGMLGASLLSHSVVLEVGALCLAIAGVMTYQATVWPLPMSMLSGRAAAGGVALIISIGNLGGFAGPYLIGWIREATGSFDAALMVVAGSVLASAVLLVVVSASLRRAVVKPVAVAVAVET